MTHSSLADFPPELVEQIISRGDPAEVAAPMSRTCRAFHALVNSNSDSHLWRTMYLEQFPFDDPRRCLTNLGAPAYTPQFDWKRELQRIIQARRALEKDWPLTKEDCTDWEAVLQTLVDMVCRAPPAPSHIASDDLSLNHLWVAAMLSRSSALDLDLDHERASASEEERQLRARLHTYYGLTKDDAKPSRRVCSRAYVYNMRNYTDDSEFGPYAKNGSGQVDWVHLQHIHHVMAMHVVDLKEEESFVFTIFPMSMPYCQSIIPKDADLDQNPDWAGVAGWWHVSFAFCDHRDLLAYNNMDLNMQRLNAGPMDTTMFEEEEFMEAFRSFHIEMHVVSTSKQECHPNRPTIYFEGAVGSHAMMRGRVEVTPDDQIRWSFVSGEQGQPMWSSEGIQIGNVRSSFGVLGSWTTATHDVGDPVGPFWLRKVHGMEFDNE